MALRKEEDLVLDVAYTLDRSYLRHLVASLTSLVAHCAQPERLRITVFHSGLVDVERTFVAESLPSTVDIRFRPVAEERIKDLPLPSRISPWITSVTYARLMIPEMMPDAPVVLYMDVDTIVLGDVTDILDVSPGDTACAAAVDPIIPTWGSRGGIQNPRVVAGRESTPYFNSGVMLMNVQAWLAQDVTAKAISYALGEGENLLLSDQETLNVVMDGAFTPLDARWNTSAFHLEQLRTPEFEKRLESTKILHYLGEQKPWHENGADRRVDRFYHAFAPQELPT